MSLCEFLFTCVCVCVRGVCASVVKIDWNAVAKSKCKRTKQTKFETHSRWGDTTTSQPYKTHRQPSPSPLLHYPQHKGAANYVSLLDYYLIFHQTEKQKPKQKQNTSKRLSQGRQKKNTVQEEYCEYFRFSSFLYFFFSFSACSAFAYLFFAANFIYFPFGRWLPSSF